MSSNSPSFRVPFSRSRSLSCGKSFENVLEIEERAKSLIEGELGSVRDGIIRLLSSKDAENEALKW